MKKKIDYKPLGMLLGVLILLALPYILSLPSLLTVLFLIGAIGLLGYSVFYIYTKIENKSQVDLMSSLKTNSEELLEDLKTKKDKKNVKV